MIWSLELQWVTPAKALIAEWNEGEIGGIEA